jgi:hypothetical protein
MARGGSGCSRAELWAVVSCLMWVLGAEFRAFGKAASTLNSWTSVAMLTHRNDGTEFGGSIYQKVNKKLETAVNLAWTAGNSNTRFGIAAKYQVDPDACFSVGTRESPISHQFYASA